MHIIQTLIISILLPIGNINSPVESSESFWKTDYQSALTEAKEDDKILMLYFAGSDWCKPCILMKRDIFDTETFHKYGTGNLVPVKFDFPRLKRNQLPEELNRKNEALDKRFNHEGASPSVVFLGSDELLIKKTGYRSGGADAYIAYVDNILARGSEWRE